MPHSVSRAIRFLRPTRPPDWRMTIPLLPLAGFMAALLSVAMPAELAAIADGNIGGAWQFWGFLFAVAFFLGIGAGVAETTGAKAVAQTMPDSPLAAFIRTSFSCLASLLSARLAEALSIISLVDSSGVFRTCQSRDTSSPLTPDLWPTGSSPRVTYEPA